MEPSWTETSSSNKVRVHPSFFIVPSAPVENHIDPFIGARDTRALHRFISPRASSPTVDPRLFCAGRAFCLSRRLTGLRGVSCHTGDRVHLFSIALTTSQQSI